MRNDFTHALFQSRTRAAVLRTLLQERFKGSVSALARKVQLSTNAVRAEVQNLATTGLVTVESDGARDVVRADLNHPAVRPLVALLNAARRSTATQPPDEVPLRESLTAWGAPLASYKPRRHLSLEESVVRGLRAAKTEPNLLTVLPLVVAKNASTFNWSALKQAAKTLKLRAELGMLLELTADVTNNNSLRRETLDLRDNRRRRFVYFHRDSRKYAKLLAQSKSPPAALKWFFYVNLPEASLRDTMRKHLA